jgi:hypothetical protein
MSAFVCVCVCVCVCVFDTVILVHGYEQDEVHNS